MMNRNAPQECQRIVGDYIYWMLVGIRIDLPKKPVEVLLAKMYLSYKQAAKAAFEMQEKHKGTWMIRVVKTYLRITTEYDKNEV